MVTFAVVWAIGFIRFVIAHRLETNLLAPFVGCVFICGLVYKALQEPEVLGEEEKSFKKYEKSTWKTIEAEKYLEKIIRLMETEKLYLDSKLTLEKMAQKLSIPPGHLSQLINERLNRNFTDFVNSYRVEEFKMRLSDPQNDRFTMVAIAEASGFNSKSTFNAAFKKHTNLTPSAFKKTLSS
jgi:AraC-like DNA-binding protein